MPRYLDDATYQRLVAALLALRDLPLVDADAVKVVLGEADLWPESIRADVEATS